jgi:hypothetical protein
VDAVVDGGCDVPVVVEELVDVIAASVVLMPASVDETSPPEAAAIKSNNTARIFMTQVVQRF